MESAALHLSRNRFESFFRSSKEIRESFLLRTCHRVEAYAWTEQPEVTISRSSRLLPRDLAWTTHRQEGAIRHLFRVAGGLESMAVGEREVREQVRAASRSILSRSPRPILRTLLRAAVDAADRAAPQVPSSRSVAAIAADRVLEESPVPFPRVLIVGSGTVGRQLAELLAPSCRVTLLFRSRAPDDGFLRATGARASPWNSLRDEVAVSDAVVTAAKSGERIIDAALVADRATPLLVIDLGVPRNVDPSVGRETGVRLIDLEGLRPRARVAPTPGVETEIDRRTQEAARSIRAFGLQVWTDHVRRRAEARRQELLQQARRFLGPLSPVQEEAVDRFSRRLVADLLLGPTQGIRAIPPGPEGDALRRWAFRWLGPDPFLP